MAAPSRRKTRRMLRTIEHIPDRDRMVSALLTLLEEPEEPTLPSDFELRELEPVADSLLKEWEEQ